MPACSTLRCWPAPGSATSMAAVGAPVLWVLRELSLFDRFYTFSRGGIDTRDVVFFVLMCTVFLAWTVMTLGSRRWRGVR